VHKFLRILAVGTLISAVLGSGCRSPRIRERPLRAHPAVRAGARGLIPGSSWAASSQEFAYSSLASEVEGSDRPAPTRIIALADMADEIGSSLRRQDPPAALPWFREAAAYATFALSLSGASEATSPLQARAFARHNHAVEELLRCAGSGPKKVNPVWREQLAASGVGVAATNSEYASIPFSELWIAADYRVTHLEHVGWEGLGVPLITLSELPDRQAVPAKFLSERLRLPATAVLHPNGELRDGAWRAQPATLSLHDPARESTVALGAGLATVPLAGDLTTPLAHQIIISPLKRLAFGGLIRPEMFNSIPGIFMRGPYQPGRIPVLFVHGLVSSPDAWLKMTNQLQADPLIRERYQFWYAYYPTGAPVAFSSARIRQTLRELRDAIDPSHGDPSLDQMVVVGHSLGGVLSKQLIQSSGRRLEQALLAKPVEEVAMSPETRAKLSRLLYFEPEASITRAVFICAPHRGSNTANQLIGRVSSGLVRRGGDADAMHGEVLGLNGPDVFQPEYRRRAPNSIDNLKFESPLLKTFSELPMAPGVPYHSIVATIIPFASTDRWTDGVVSYESAHLDGAESEIMIRHNHFANDTPEAAVEVQRILRLHVGAAKW
jgi:pimeloyl-ACP methyl ester carboxylesterase